MRQKLEQYMITPIFNTSALHTGANMSHSDHRAAIKARHIQILDAIRAPVTDIITRHAGTVINDASGYGVDSHPDQFRSYMIVQVNESAFNELQAIPDARVEACCNTTFNLPRTF